jgi:hypothetical protein
VQLPAFCASEHPPTQIEKRPEDSTVVRRLLHCGSSIRPMSALGHFRQIGTLRTLTGCPLRSESGQVGGHRAKSALCQSRPNAPQQIVSLFDHLVGAREGLDGRATCSDISSNATAILRVGLAVMPTQIFFFAQDLTVEQPCGRDQINQTYPIWEDEKFSNQDNRKGHINGIATESKNAVGYESVGMVSVNAHSKALPKGNQAPQEQQQPRQAKQHSDPRDYLGMEKLVRRHSRPVEGRGEQDIE